MGKRISADFLTSKNVPFFQFQKWIFSLTYSPPSNICEIFATVKKWECGYVSRTWHILHFKPSPDQKKKKQCLQIKMNKRHCKTNSIAEYFKLPIIAGKILLTYELFAIKLSRKECTKVHIYLHTIVYSIYILREKCLLHSQCHLLD